MNAGGPRRSSRIPSLRSPCRRSAPSWLGTSTLRELRTKLTAEYTRGGRAEALGDRMGGSGDVADQTPALLLGAPPHTPYRSPLRTAQARQMLRTGQAAQ